jgi:MFS transporter, SP family, arabinose:H+ symporter
MCDGLELACLRFFLSAYSAAVPFGFFSVMMVVQIFVVLFVFPGTKGISLEEMERKLGIV